MCSTTSSGRTPRCSDRIRRMPGGNVPSPWGFRQRPGKLKAGRKPRRQPPTPFGGGFVAQLIHDSVVRLVQSRGERGGHGGAYFRGGLRGRPCALTESSSSVTEWARETSAFTVRLSGSGSWSGVARTASEPRGQIVLNRCGPWRCRTVLLHLLRLLTGSMTRATAPR